MQNIEIMRSWVLKLLVAIGLAAMLAGAAAQDQPRRFITCCYGYALQFWLGADAIQASVSAGNGITVRLDPAQGRSYWIDNAVALKMGRFEAQIDRYMCLPCRVEFNARVRGKHELEKHLD
jgi:hypothetical protein